MAEAVATLIALVLTFGLVSVCLVAGFAFVVLYAVIALITFRSRLKDEQRLSPSYGSSEFDVMDLLMDASLWPISLLVRAISRKIEAGIVDDGRP